MKALQHEVQIYPQLGPVYLFNLEIWSLIHSLIHSTNIYGIPRMNKALCLVLGDLTWKFGQDKMV